MKHVVSISLIKNASVLKHYVLITENIHSQKCQVRGRMSVVCTNVCACKSNALNTKTGDVIKKLVVIISRLPYV